MYLESYNLCNMQYSVTPLLIHTFRSEGHNLETGGRDKKTKLYDSLRLCNLGQIT